MTMPDWAGVTCFWSRDLLTDTCRLPRCSRINVVGTGPAPLALDVFRGPSLTDDRTASMPEDWAVRNLSWTTTLTADLTDGQTWRYSTKDLPGWLNVNMPEPGKRGNCRNASARVGGLAVVETKSVAAMLRAVKLARHSAVSCSSPADDRRWDNSISITLVVSVNRLRHHLVCSITTLPSSFVADSFCKVAVGLYTTRCSPVKRKHQKNVAYTYTKDQWLSLYLPRLMR